MGVVSHNLHSTYRICHECGKKFGTLSYDMGSYAYKVKVSNSKNTYVFCSYGCYNKFLNRREAEGHVGKRRIF